MQITFTWCQLAEAEALIDGLRTAQAYGSGEIHRESGAWITWNDRITLEIPDCENQQTCTQE